MLQVAVFELALPVGRATAAQPVSVVPSPVNATLPVGAEPFTVAVKVTPIPTVDGFDELVAVVVVATVLVELTVTPSTKVVLSLGSVPASMIVCAPLLATEKAMLNAVKVVFAGETRLPI